MTTVPLWAWGATLAVLAVLIVVALVLTRGAENSLRAAAVESPRRARWLLELKKHPEPTAAALRGASSSLLAFAAVACAIVVGDVLVRAGVHSQSRSSLQLVAGLLAGAVALALDLAPRSLASANPLAWGLSLSGLSYAVCRLLGWPVRLMLRLFDALLLHRGATARYKPPPPPQIDRY